jgi:nucleotide-binding universal stress UspA family protein
MEVFMYKTILVPLDGSPRAEGILPHVEKLAMQFKSKVIFIKVLSLFEITNQIDIYQDYALDIKRKKEEINVYLAGVQDYFQKKGIEASVVVEQGYVVDTILAVSQRENADLIAIASHGRSGLSRVFYGSVTAGILQKIDRPLLVIRTRNV